MKIHGVAQVEKTIRTGNKLSRRDSPRDANAEKSLETDEDRTESKLQKFMKGERLSIKATNRVLKNSFLEPVEKLRSRRISHEDITEQLDDTLELNTDKMELMRLPGGTESIFEDYREQESKLTLSLHGFQKRAKIEKRNGKKTKIAPQKP